LNLKLAENILRVPQKQITKQNKDKADGVIVLQWREGQVTLPFEYKKGFRRHAN